MTEKAVCVVRSLYSINVNTGWGCDMGRATSTGQQVGGGACSQCKIEDPSNERIFYQGERSAIILPQNCTVALPEVALPMWKLCPSYTWYTVTLPPLQLHSLCYWSRRHSPANLISDWGGQNQSLGRELGLYFTFGQGPCPPHAACGPHAAMDSRPGARTYLDRFTRVSPWFQALHQRQEDKGTSIMSVSFPDCCWWSGNETG